MHITKLDIKRAQQFKNLYRVFISQEIPHTECLANIKTKVTQTKGVSNE